MTKHSTGKRVSGTPYRGGKRGREDETLYEVFQLLQDNDFSNLARKQPQFYKGAMSWAKLAEFAVDAVSLYLQNLASDKDVRVALDSARKLASLLEIRDSIRGARVTAELRHQIGLLNRSASTLDELISTKDGKRDPSIEMAGRAVSLRQYLSRLGCLPITPYVVSA